MAMHANQMFPNRVQVDENAGPRHSERQLGYTQRRIFSAWILISLLGFLGVVSFCLLWLKADGYF